MPDNYNCGAIVAVQRACNWAEELGYITATPLKKIKQPPAKRRKTYMTPEDFGQLLGLLKDGDPLRGFFLFVRMTGCRQQEARHAEARHVELENERIVFRAEESKAKRTERIIYVQGDALEIIRRLVAAYPEGKVFRNRRGLLWSKFAVCNRSYRLNHRTGKRMFAYAARHGFATRKLIQGKGTLTISQLMGHADGAMLARVYGHLDKDVDFQRRALDD